MYNDFVRFSWHAVSVLLVVAVAIFQLSGCSVMGAEIGAVSTFESEAQEIESLIKQLGDDKVSIRRHAKKALIQIGEPAIPLLIGALSDEGYIGRTRTGAAEVLSQIREPAVPALMEALSHQNKSVRQAAAKALRKIGTPEAMKAAKQYEESKGRPMTDLKIITTRSGDQYTGTLLYATDTLLVLWCSKKPYNGRKLDEFAKPFHFSEIQRIVVEKKGHAARGLGYGALIGGILGTLMGLAGSGDCEGWGPCFTAGQLATMGAIALAIPAGCIGGISGGVQDLDDDFFVGGNAETYKRLVPRLKEYATFSSQPPPELQTLVVQKAEEIPSMRTEATTPISKPLFVPSAAKLHISLGGGFLPFNKANGNIRTAFSNSGFGGSINGFFGGEIYYPYSDLSIPVAWNLEVGYNLTDHLRLGLAQNKILFGEIHGIGGEREKSTGTSYGLFFDYVRTPIHSSLGLSRWKHAVGAGLSYNVLTVDGSLGYGPTSDSFALKKHVIGGHLRLIDDYYISRNFSLQFKLEGRITPSVTVPTQTGLRETLERHAVNFSAVEFSLGPRLHF